MDPWERPPTPEYIAAFFDGEGHIANRTTYPVVALSQTDPRILLDIQEVWGGKLRQKGDGSGGYRLTLNKEDSVRLAEAILPYSRLKRDGLRLVLARRP